jgi:hypothetical protein
MSDDTPTERFDPRKPEGGTPPEGGPAGTPTGGEDTPTELFDAAAASAEHDDAPGSRNGAGSAPDAPTERFAAPVTPEPLPPTRGGYSGPIDTYNPNAPTERFAPGNDEPTRVLPAYTAAPGYRTTTTTSSPPPTPPKKKSKALMWWLIGIGAALLVTVIVLLVLLFGGNDEEPAVTPAPTTSETPEPVPTPSETEAPPEPEPTETVAPPVASPTFATFSAPSSAECDEGDDSAPLTFSWSSSDAVRAYLGVGTQNAALNPTVSDLPPTATYTDLEYDCTVGSQVYTVTLEDEAGSLTSRTVTITR